MQGDVLFVSFFIVWIFAMIFQAFRDQSIMMCKFKVGDIVTINTNIISEIYLLDFLPSFISHPSNGSDFRIRGFEDNCIEKLDKNT